MTLFHFRLNYTQLISPLIHVICYVLSDFRGLSVRRDAHVGYHQLMKTLNLLRVCVQCVNLRVCVPLRFMWAGYIIKINDIVCPQPKQTHTLLHTHAATNPSWRLRLCFSKRTIFCLPLWLSLSHSLSISPSISVSLSAQNAKLLHFSLAPLLPQLIHSSGY